MAKAQRNLKLAAPPDAHVPDNSTQLHAMRLYAAVFEAASAAQQAQQQLQHWNGRREKAAADYLSLVQAAKAKLPPPPDGKAWQDKVDTTTYELSFVLVDAPKETP
jgi:hypothetical protein